MRAQVQNACCNDVNFNRRAYKCCGAGGSASSSVSYTAIVPINMCGGPTLSEYISCSGSVDGAPSPYDEYTGCCGITDDSAYDKRSHACCGGSIQEGDACCDAVAFNSAADLCCSGTLYLGANSATTKCCGTSTYDSTTQVCCNGVVQTLTSPDQVCCGTELFVPTAESKCCGRTIYDATTQTCCGGVPVDSTTFNSAEFICCNGVAYSTVYYDSCCGATPYKAGTTPVCCGGSLVYAGGCCCDKYPYAPVAGENLFLLL